MDMEENTIEDSDFDDNESAASSESQVSDESSGSTKDIIYHLKPKWLKQMNYNLFLEKEKTIESVEKNEKILRSLRGDQTTNLVLFVAANEKEISNK